MSLDRLAPLVGFWQGRARICYPGSDMIEMAHTERVRWVGDRVITIEGNSYSGKSSPDSVFAALAVIFPGDDLAQDDQLHWHAFRGGHVHQTVAEVADDGFCWSSPSPAGIIDYTAEFGERFWQERGMLTLAGSQHRVFSMELCRGV
jgi:hypothetical protein